MVNDVMSSIIQGDGSYIETGHGPSQQEIVIKEVKNGETQYSFHGKKSLESIRMSRKSRVSDHQQDESLVKLLKQSGETKNEEIEERDIIHD